MFSLAKGFYLQYTRKDEYYVLLLGIDNAGKTTLLEKIKTVYLGVQGLPPDKITPTVGLNIATIQHFTGKARINFWDLGGQTDLQSIWKSYYAECHAIVFMVDSCDSQRIEDVQMVFDRMISNDEVEGVPVIMLANKQDMDNALPVAQIKEIFNNIAQKVGILIEWFFLKTVVGRKR